MEVPCLQHSRPDRPSAPAAGPADCHRALRGLAARGAPAPQQGAGERRAQLGGALRPGRRKAARPLRLHAAAQAPAAAAQAASPALKRMYTRLQNGSDIRGIAVEGVEGEARNFTPTIAFYIGAGLADLLAQRLGKASSELRVAIGRDPRISGPLLGTALAAGLAHRGARVGDTGLATTPAMFMACKLPGLEYDGAVMITASHLPFNRNGLKFFTAEAGFEKADISALLGLAVEAHSAAAAPATDPEQPYSDDSHVLAAALATDPGLVSKIDVMPAYAAHLRGLIIEGIAHPASRERPLEGLHIVVDAGNGSGGFLASDVLAPLGADTSGSQFLDPDGYFPNHIPNPEAAAAMEAGVAAVLGSKADLGIVVDTDVDRSAVVAASGQAINSNRYIALMAYIALQKYPGTTIVTDSVTSNGLTTFIEGLGGKHFRYRRGYKNVIGKGIELGRAGTSCELMMETSGHGAMRENFYLDDGTYSASQIVIQMAKAKLRGEGTDVAATVLAPLKEPQEAREFRLKVLAEDFQAVNKGVLAAFHAWLTTGAGSQIPGWALEAENWEGWRVAIEEGEGRRGWLLLRASLHDPLLVLNMESELAQGGCDAYVAKMREFFEAETDHAKLDLAKLR